MAAAIARLHPDWHVRFHAIVTGTIEGKQFHFNLILCGPKQHANHLDAQSQGRPRHAQKERFDGCLGEVRTSRDLPIHRKKQLQRSARDIHRAGDCRWRRRHDTLAAGKDGKRGSS
jgi:hypothetical protein